MKCFVCGRTIAWPFPGVSTQVCSDACNEADRRKRAELAAQRIKDEALLQALFPAKR